MDYQSLNSRSLSTNTALQICRAIKGVEMDIRKAPGTTLFNDRARRVIYTPPEGEVMLRERLANWDQWMHGTLPGTAEIDPLVRMAAGPYQFEAIRPFTDGNGRTGRVINLLYLVEQGLLDIPVLYLSRHILRNKADYYSGLQSITETGAWEPWLLYMPSGVTKTARWTMNKIVAVPACSRRPRNGCDETPARSTLASWPNWCSWDRTAASRTSWRRDWPSARRRAPISSSSRRSASCASTRRAG